MILVESTGSFYVGSAVSLSKRMRDHVSKLRRGNHPNKWLQNTYTKHGLDDFKVCIVEYDILPETLLEREQVYLDRWYDNQVVCMNMCPTAGNALGRKHSEETKKKMSVAHKGKKASTETLAKQSVAGKLSMDKLLASGFDTNKFANKGDKHPMHGKKHSEESIAKMSASSKGVPNEKNGKKVGQYQEKNGELIATFVSACEAGRKYRIRPNGITRSIKSNFKTRAGGFFWAHLLNSE